jgi:hypothetical protein
MMNPIILDKASTGAVMMQIIVVLFIAFHTARKDIPSERNYQDVGVFSLLSAYYYLFLFFWLSECLDASDFPDFGD